jgi:hypothetical protein
MSDQGDGARVRTRRPALWLLLLPAVFFCAAPLAANRIEPRVLGVPFLLAWVIAATVLSPLVIWAVGRLDPLYRSGADEPIPSDPGHFDANGTGGGPNTPRGGAR